MLPRVTKEHLQGLYGVREWEDAEDFMTQMAQQSGRLLKGGEPDLNTIAKMLLHDWQKGKIPFFVNPPEKVDNKESS